MSDVLTSYAVSVNEIIPYRKIEEIEGFRPERGMNYKIKDKNYSIVLMSVAKGAPYKDKISEAKRIIAQTRDWLKCETRYDLAIRTNSIFSVPLLALMLYSAQAKNVANPLLEIDGSFGPAWSSTSLWASILLVILIELNLIFGKNRNWMNSSKKIILTGLIFTAVLGYLLRYS